MRISHQLRRRVATLASVAAVAALLPATVATTAQAASAAPTLSCSGDAAIVKTLSTGSSWAMCATIHTNKGLVLEQIQFQPANESTWYRVLDSFYLSQLNVPYDTGLNVWDDLTSYGFGNQYLQKLSSVECPTGELKDVHQNWVRRNVTYERTIPAICVAEEGTGVAYRSHEQTWGSPADSPLYTEQGAALSISSISKVDWYEYMEKIEFTDGGTITASLGATGDVSYEDFADGTGDYDTTTGWPIGTGDSDYAASHWHNAIWRADFGLDDQSVQKVERYDTGYTGESATSGSKGEILTTQETDITTSGSYGKNGTDSDDDLTWFRVVAPNSLNADQHPRSYEISINKEQNYDANPVTQPQVTFTSAAACREYASRNLNAECSGQSILDYVEQDGTKALTDPVAWINIGFHHVVRDEDQSPMETHWQTFSLVPRDFTAQSPITPADRECINGNPGGELHSSCVAPPNLTLPTISGTAEIGSTLTATDGTWNQTNLGFTYQWLRGGAAIPGATTSTYTVTAADAGKALAVQVTATSTESALSTTVTSQSTTVSALAATRPATITGTAKVGKTLTVSTGTWNKPGATYSYQWSVAGKAVAGATKATFVPRVADAGKAVTAVVTAKKSGETATSAAKAVTVPKLASTTKATLAKKKVSHKAHGKVTVKVTTSPSSSATGKVTVYDGKKKITTATLKAKGKVVVTLPRLAKGKHKISVRYAGSAAVSASTSGTKKITSK